MRGVIAGAFDVIHPGYIAMFNECNKHCDYLVVLLHEDPSAERPEKLKPVLRWFDRWEMLRSFRQVDFVAPYKTESDLLEYLENGKFDVRFLGDDYKDKPYTGDNLNIPVHYINRDHGWSATEYKQQIAEQWNAYTQK